MAIEYKTPDEIADEYLTHLKALKPEVNTAQQDSDWWIRSQVVGGVLSGIYADQQLVAQDIFPQSARREALEKHLITYFGTGFKEAQSASGYLEVTGDIGSVVEEGTEFTYDANGNSYQAIEEVTLAATSAEVLVQSVSTGQDQNLFAGTELSVPSPPAGIDSTATVVSPGLTDGRNVESSEEAVLRLLNRIQNPPAGGTESDYEGFALNADASVTGAKVKRYPYGLGTVGVVITSGTTDIDSAVDNDEPVIRIPSGALLESVGEYIDALNPLTDCLFMFSPTEVEIDVDVQVRYSEGNDGDTVLAGQSLTLNELLEREIKRAIYKVPIGGRTIGASGYVLASELEEAIDFKMSALPYQEGELVQAIIDRQILDLAATGVNRLLSDTDIAIPGTITITEL